VRRLGASTDEAVAAVRKVLESDWDQPSPARPAAEQVDP
jgi:hypothetical protein